MIGELLLEPVEALAERAGRGCRRRRAPASNQPAPEPELDPAAAHLVDLRDA